MSTERGVTKRRLSGSEGTANIESDTANLREQQQKKEQQQQKQQYKDPPSSTTNRETPSPSPLQTAQDDENENAKDISKLQPRASGTVTTKTTTEVKTTGVATASVAAASVDDDDSRPRQVIAVSANKNPTAFFQLAKKFLITNDMCDLSALEGAIVAAVDAAHLLERSQLASIVRIHTSYVNVEPKRRRQASHQQQQQQQGDVSIVTTSATKTEDNLPLVREDTFSSHQSESISLNTRHAISLSSTAAAAADAVVDPNTTSVSSTSSSTGGKISSIQQNTRQEGSSRNSSGVGGGGRELRRARILITVKRTESYKRWLDENPLQHQAIIAGADIGDSNITPPGPSPSYHHQEEEENQK